MQALSAINWVCASSTLAHGETSHLRASIAQKSGASNARISKGGKMRASPRLIRAITARWSEGELAIEQVAANRSNAHKKRKGSWR